MQDRGEMLGLSFLAASLNKRCNLH